jgi:hypothetical protein
MTTRKDTTRPEPHATRTTPDSRREVARPGTPLHAAIARRAYEIYEAAGRPEGQDVAHWLQAEAEILNR